MEMWGTSVVNHAGHRIGFSHVSITRIQWCINEMVAVSGAAPDRASL